MWRNYLTVAVRALAKNRVYSAINIAGLAIGMAACIVILLFVRYETSYDAMLPGVENAYEFQTFHRDRQTGQEMNLQMVAIAAKAPLVKDFPQIEQAVYALGNEPVAMVGGRVFAMKDGLLVDENLFDILRVPFAAGDPAHALDRPGQLVLSQTEAERLFGGTAAAMGRTVTLTGRGGQHDYIVTGVLDGPTRQSHRKFSFVARLDLASYAAEQPQLLTSWGWQSGWLYVRLKPGTDVATMNARMPAWEKRNIPDELGGSQRYNTGDEADFALVNVRDIHLGRAQAGASTPGNDSGTIATFAVIAILILAMACVNFTNLATARASQRAREVALRKVLGAGRSQLIVQFLCEAVLIAAIAMLLALGLVELTLPYIADFLQADLTLAYIGRGGVLLPVIALVLGVGLAAGAYPAFFLARFQPARVLKANKSAADAQGSGRLRNILVVAQFAVSIGLIVCTAVVYGQTVFARTSDPGYRRDGLIQIEGIARRQTWPTVDAFIDQLRRVDGVVAAGRSDIGIATRNNTNNGVTVPGRSDLISIGTYDIDDRFFETMGIPLVAGRSFDRNRPADDTTTPFPQQAAAERALTARGINVVANELAVKRLGLSSPRDAIGRQVYMGTEPEYGGQRPATIVGVVKDSRFRSIRDPLQPIFFRYITTGHGALLIRYRGDPAGINAKIEALWKRMFPDVPYDGTFSEEIVGRLYALEAARAAMFAGFAILAVVIGCLGLFGLAAFTAERRTKEIGIRKVLGARTRDIVRLLVWQFSQPVLIANLIAWPIAWWVMRDWLNGFDTRIALTPVPFLIAGVLALGIAIATISAHAFRVARTSPIRALRYE